MDLDRGTIGHKIRNRCLLVPASESEAESVGYSREQWQRDGTALWMVSQLAARFALRPEENLTPALLFNPIQLTLAKIICAPQFYIDRGKLGVVGQTSTLTETMCFINEEEIESVFCPSDFEGRFDHAFVEFARLLEHSFDRMA